MIQLINPLNINTKYFNIIKYIENRLEYLNTMFKICPIIIKRINIDHP